MIKKNYNSIRKLIPDYIKILVVSKNQSILSIKKLYEIGVKDFGESYVQEMVKKYKSLPKDIRWHMIGKIQTNKLKYIIPFIYLIHSVQKFKHIEFINKIGCKYNRKIPCLLQIRISNEKSKSGILYQEIFDFIQIIKNKNIKQVKILGIMGIASNKEIKKVKNEFLKLSNLYQKLKNIYGYKILSMGMSQDYNEAINYNTTMIRLGSIIFR